MDFNFLEFIDFWKKNFDSGYIIDKSKLEKEFLINKIAQINNMLFVVIDYKLDILFFTDNVEEIFGYSKDEILNSKVKVFFKSLTMDSFTFPLNALKWHQTITKEIGIDKLKEGFNYIYCGITLKKKNGEKIKLLMNHWPFDIQNNGFGTIGLIILQDITFSYESNHYWCKINFDKNPFFNQYFHSNNKLGRFNNMYSTREKDILRLIYEGYTSKDISEKLFISQGTVDKHRKNILEKSGFKDIPGLFQTFGLNKLLQ